MGRGSTPSATQVKTVKPRRGQRIFPSGSIQYRLYWHWPLNRKATLALGATVIGVAIWETDAVLCLATAAGIGTLFLVQRGKNHLLGAAGLVATLGQTFWRACQTFPLLLAGVAAMGATSGTYVALKLWQASPNSWLGLGLLIQGLGIYGLLVLGMTVSQQQRQGHQEQQWQELIQALTHPQALSRYLAIRRLSRLPLSPDQAKIYQESLVLLLATEAETQVKQAALETLHALPMPLPLKLSAKPSLSVLSQVKH